MTSRYHSLRRSHSTTTCSCKNHSAVHEKPNQRTAQGERNLIPVNVGWITRLNPVATPSPSPHLGEVAEREMRGGAVGEEDGVVGGGCEGDGVVMQRLRKALAAVGLPAAPLRRLRVLRF